MKLYRLASSGGWEATEQPPRTLESRDVRVRVHACSLNYRDLLVADGRYGRAKPGLVPLSDGAGEVIEIGSEVRSLTVGDRVAGCFFTGWEDGPLTPDKSKTARGGAVDGVLAETVDGPEQSWVQVPDHLSYQEGSTLPCAALTAWTSLFEHACLRAGQTVLVQGTGGVSIFALQFAKAAGIRTIITSSSDEKLARAKELGADVTVNYQTQPDWEKAAFEATDGRGVDAVLEVGGAETLPRSLKAAGFGGTICVIGVLSGVAASLSIGHVQSKNLRLVGVYVGPRSSFLEMNRFLEQNRIHPVINHVVPFDEAPRALVEMAEARHFGKIVVA